MSETAGQPEESVTIDLSTGNQPVQQEPQVSSRFVTTVNKYKENLLERPIRYDVLSIIFTILILIGGLVGYITKDSVPSLVSGVIFAILLAFGTYLEGARRNPYLLLVTLFALGAVMVYRYVQSFNFLPAGLIGLLTIIMFVRHCYLLYLNKQSARPAAGDQADEQTPVAAAAAAAAAPQSE